MAAALSAFQELRDLAAALETESPTVAVRTQLAWGPHGIGLVMDEMGKPAEAIMEWQKAVAIRQKLADANPTVPSFQFDMAKCINNIGWVLNKTGKPAEALKEHQKALAILQELADANPAVTAFQTVLGMSHNHIADALSATGKPAEALPERQQALGIWQKLADANPAVVDFQSELARSHYWVGRLWARQGRLEEAFASHHKAQALCQQLANAAPKNGLYTLRLGYSHAFRGDAYVRAGHPAEAASDLRVALELWTKYNEPDSEDRFERARALARLAGLAADGKSGVSATEAAAFADQAFATLRDAFQAGWGKWAELKKPDFDPLRGRDDFRKLVAEMQAKARPSAKPKD
jgi:tetratricopeptide (TPR) repeat protein